MTIDQEKVSVIIPILNSVECLPTCLGSVIAAMKDYGNAELILIDNGSTDGSYEMLLSDYARVAKIEQIKGVTISALRNRGAGLAQGNYLCFIDSDCVISRDYFGRAMEVFATIGADATGCYYGLPPSPTWIAETWHHLHWRQGDGYVPYLYAGNFIIKKDVFERIGRFDESLITGEDAELGLRLTADGYKIYKAEAVSAIHLDNPKSLLAFFKKQAWHGLGMFGGLKSTSLDKPLAMTFVHLILTVVAALNLLLNPGPLWVRSAAFVLATATVPLLTVFYRSAWRGKIYRPMRSWLLYYLYFAARVYALFKIIVLSFSRSGRPQARLHPS